MHKQRLWGPRPRALHVVYATPVISLMVAWTQATVLINIGKIHAKTTSNAVVILDWLREVISWRLTNLKCEFFKVFCAEIVVRLLKVKYVY